MRRATFKQEVIEILRIKKHSVPLKEKRKSILFQIPEVKPLPLTAGALIFGGITILGMAIGATISTYVFFGTITLAGLIAISESNKYVKYMITKSNRVVDLIIFGLTMYATVLLGVTMAASLTFAGLGYTLVYAPWLRSRNK
ncbi:MAG: hypothetical protein Q8K04_11695 [Lutibacter sp.]|nr:hypothetical protein [Lutibacter sp.]